MTSGGVEWHLTSSIISASCCGGVAGVVSGFGSGAGAGSGSGSGSGSTSIASVGFLNGTGCGSGSGASAGLGSESLSIYSATMSDSLLPSDMALAYKLTPVCSSVNTAAYGHFSSRNFHTTASLEEQS